MIDKHREKALVIRKININGKLNKGLHGLMNMTEI